MTVSEDESPGDADHRRGLGHQGRQVARDQRRTNSEVSEERHKLQGENQGEMGKETFDTTKGINVILIIKRPSLTTSDWHYNCDIGDVAEACVPCPLPPIPHLLRDV